MKKLILLIFAFLVSCSQLIDEPKNLISKDKMSELVAEFALNDQINTYIPGTDVENATRVALIKKKIAVTDFTESYKYYTATGDLEDILNDAQEIILKKDPATEKYIQKKIKEDAAQPAVEK